MSKDHSPKRVLSPFQKLVALGANVININGQRVRYGYLNGEFIVHATEAMRAIGITSPAGASPFIGYVPEADKPVVPRATFGKGHGVNPRALTSRAIDAIALQRNVSVLRDDFRRGRERAATTRI